MKKYYLFQISGIADLSDQIAASFQQVSPNDFYRDYFAVFTNIFHAAEITLKSPTVGYACAPV